MYVYIYYNMMMLAYLSRRRPSAALPTTPPISNIVEIKPDSGTAYDN